MSINSANTTDCRHLQQFQSTHMVECEGRKKQQQFNDILTCFDTMSSPVYKPNKPRVFFIAGLDSSGKYLKSLIHRLQESFLKHGFGRIFHQTRNSQKVFGASISDPDFYFLLFEISNLSSFSPNLQCQDIFGVSLTLSTGSIQIPDILWFHQTKWSTKKNA